MTLQLRVVSIQIKLEMLKELAILVLLAPAPRESR